MEGKLVRLRAYEKSDLDAVMKWVNDEEVTDMLGGATADLSGVVDRGGEVYRGGDAASSDTQKTFAIETLAERRYIGGIVLT